MPDGPTPDRRPEWDRAPAHFRALLEHAGIGLWEFDDESGAFACSPHLPACHGVPVATPADALYEALMACVFPEDRTRVRAAMRAGVDAPVPSEVEFRIRRADTGAERWLRSRSVWVVAAGGAPGHRVGMLMDVTAQRSDARRLDEIERELARAQRMARLGSWSWNVRTNEVWWSPQVWQLFGFDPATPASVEALRSIFPADQQAVYDAAVQGALMDGTPYDVEVSTVLADGRELIVHAIGEVERDADGAPVAMHGAVQDVTEARQRARAAIASEQDFRTLAIAGPMGVFRTGPDGRPSYANPRLLALWRMTAAEFSERWRDVVHPDDVERVSEAGRLAVSGGLPFRAEYRILVGDGERHVRVSSSPVLDDVGHFVGQIGIVEDITEDVRAREQATRSETEARHAQKLESLGVLAGGIAHDFNNLLVGVLTNAGLALDALGPASPVHDLVTNIERAAQRAADLTRQLLAYSGRGRLVVGPVDLSELVREMADLLRTVVSKRARVVLELARDLPFIEGDATQLRQVVMNLITNASDALGERDGTITLRTRLASGADAEAADAIFGAPSDDPIQVALDVSDDGIGMDAATMQRIFDPFFTTKFTGRGLGLSAAHGIVRGHRGVMVLRSRPGAGTRFTIILPGMTRAASVAVTEAPPPTREDGARGRILVVDDDESVRAVLTRLLRARGFPVEAAANGRAAVDLVFLDPAAFAVVLLDLTMPAMNGRETFAALYAIAPSLPVVMMSGYSEDEMGAGDGPVPAGMLQKPFSPAEVFALLDRLSAGAHGTEEGD